MDISELTVTVVEPSPMQGKIIEAELNTLGIDKILYQRSGQTALADIALDELRTLVVDDSSLARKHISRVLKNLGISDILNSTLIARHVVFRPSAEGMLPSSVLGQGETAQRSRRCPGVRIHSVSVNNMSGKH